MALASTGDAALDERYATIAAAQPRQQAKYLEWVKSGAVDGPALEKMANDLGLELDVESGTVSYGPGGPLDPKLSFDLMYVRHGKTTGNTEPRVYQGYCDEPANALNDIGLSQADEAADKLDALGLAPDLVVLSPLARAADTGKTWLKRHPELDAVTEVWDSSHEMAFGNWDNVMVKDLEDDHIGHLFYLAQNAVVKASDTYPLMPDAPIENFVEVLVRMRGLLDDLESRMKPLAESSGKRPLVLMYGHSMAGAAIGFLTGEGKVVDGEKFLGFDGKYILPNATPVYLYKK